MNYVNFNEENVIFEYLKDDFLKNYIFEMFKLKEMDYFIELKFEGFLYFFMFKLVEIWKSIFN